jgi:hypothetical protein
MKPTSKTLSHKVNRFPIQFRTRVPAIRRYSEECL